MSSVSLLLSLSYSGNDEVLPPILSSVMEALRYHEDRVSLLVSGLQVIEQIGETQAGRRHLVNGGVIQMSLGIMDRFFHPSMVLMS